MRMGGPTFDIEEEPQALVTYHQENGFSAAFMREVEDKVKRDEILAAYEEANILPAELGAYRLNILQTDAARRQENLDEISRRLAYADEAGIAAASSTAVRMSPKVGVRPTRITRANAPSRTRSRLFRPSWIACSQRRRNSPWNQKGGCCPMSPRST